MTHEEILLKISNLSTKQTEFLAEFLNKPEEFVNVLKDPKEEIVIMATLLKEFRSTTVYKYKSYSAKHASFYAKYVKKQEKEIESKLYEQLRESKCQLKKGGYNSASLEFQSSLTDEEKTMIDGIFPENKIGNGLTITVPLPEMTETELQFKDAEISARHKSSRVEIPEDMRKHPSSYEEHEEHEELIKKLDSLMVDLSPK